jgi:transcriptional regulator with XRE-family HTH domain
VKQPEERLADRVRDRRKQLGLSQPQIAERLHAAGWWLANQQLVSNVERGRKTLTVIEARKFALALDVEADWLVTGLGIPGEAVAIKGVRATATAQARSGRLSDP